jgi:molecular chaperone GrpE
MIKRAYLSNKVFVKVPSSIRQMVLPQMSLPISNNNPTLFNKQASFSLCNCIGLVNKSKNNIFKFSNKKFFGNSKQKEEENQSSNNNHTKEEQKEETDKKAKETTLNNEQMITLKKYNLLKELYEDSENNLTKARSKFDELRKAYVESQSDIERIRKRSEIEIAQAKEFSVTKFAKDMLDVYDNFERALQSIKHLEQNSQISNEEKIEQYKTFAEGVVMTKDSLVRILGLHGIKEYIPLKEKFDPNKHDAVFQSQSTELLPGTVSDVMQSGFTIGSRVLRPAKVGVVKK